MYFLQKRALVNEEDEVRQKQALNRNNEIEHSSRNVSAARFSNNRQTVQFSSNSNSVHISYNSNTKDISDDNFTAHTSTDRHATLNNVHKVMETGDDHTMQVVENDKKQMFDRNQVCNLFLNIYAY